MDDLRGRLHLRAALLDLLQVGQQSGHDPEVEDDADEDD
jgi:hypothetical protein